jgi:hypothetical protein
MTACHDGENTMHLLFSIRIFVWNLAHAKAIDKRYSECILGGYRRFP